jgi:serine/threonine protein kinase
MVPEDLLSSPTSDATAGSRGLSARNHLASHVAVLHTVGWTATSAALLTTVQHKAYTAPEAWENQTNTFKIGVYAVGLVFYQILTLEHPLSDAVGESDNFRDWEKAHLYHQCADVRSLRNDAPISVAQLLSRMVNKRPVDRPTWDDVLKILSQPEIFNRPAVPTVAAAVEGAITRIQALKREELETSRRQSERDKQLDLYAFSCKTLLRSLEPVVEEFNTNFQHGKITIHEDAGSSVYRLPLGNNITVSFFEMRRGIKIRNGEVIGGGWIGLSSGRSANLILLKYSADDLYGQWIACEVEIMALVEPRSRVGRYGIIGTTVIPFGLKDAFFYDQIQYATVCTHVFTYRFSDDVSSHFAMLLSKAYES